MKIFMILYMMLIKSGTCQQNTNYIYHKEELTLTQGLLLGSITVLQKEYIVSFKLKPTQFLSGWRSVLHLTLGNDMNEYGDRNPGVWFNENGLGSLSIFSAVNGDNSYYFNTPEKLPLNVWSHVKIYQSLLDGKYCYAIDLNGTNIHKVENNEQKDFNSIFVYASDPWYDAQDGSIAELLIVNGNTKNSLQTTSWWFASWSQLRNWTSCSSSIGFRNWTRECNTSNIQEQCFGNDTEVEECFVFWAQWSTWTSCNVSNGFTNRTRTCSASNDLLWCSGEKFEVMRCFDYIYYKEEITLTQSLLLGSITVLRKEYIVSFKLKPTQFLSEWRSVLHLTMGTDAYYYGDRNPGVWFNVNGLGNLTIFSAVSGDKYYVVNSARLPLNEWSHVRIYQILLDGKYWYAIDLNGTNIHKVENNDPRDFKNIKVYASGPWHYNQHGSIAELLIINRNTTFWSEWSIWTSCNASIGFMNRTRECINTNIQYQCLGKNSEAKKCFVLWSEWSIWTCCNASIGFMNRTRECNNTNVKYHCIGINYEAKECFDFIYHKEELILTRGMFLGSINVLQKEYIVSFKVKPAQYSSEWRSVLHLTLDDNFAHYGDRNPGVWFHESGTGMLHICAAVNGNFNYKVNTAQLPLNEWSYIKIYQYLSDGKYWFAIDLNGINFHRVVNNNSRDFNNMMVYASNPWQDAQNGSIAELLIINGNTIFWSEWSSWTSCNASIGFMNRTRECNTTNIQYQCFGKNSEAKECFVLWSEWNIWTSCNASIRFMNRTRECNNTNIVDQCFGKSFEVTKCIVLWSEWSIWTSCNASIGFMNRTRECNTTNIQDHCFDKKTEVEGCFAFWLEWSSWTSCNASIGYMNRTRECNNTNVVDQCFGKKFEVEECFDIEKWAMWSECSVTCGVGNKRRISLDATKTFVMLDNCMTIACPEDGTWGTWSHSDCLATCGIRKKKFNRSCNKPLFNGRDCMGVHNYTEDCNDVICPVNGNWSNWSSWSFCNQPCGGGDKSRFRSCSNPMPKFGGLDCNGCVVDFKNCLWQSCKSVGLNLAAHFIDEEYIEPYSFPTSTVNLALRDKIRDAISKLYNSHKLNRTFNIVVHSMESRP